MADGYSKMDKDVMEPMVCIGDGPGPPNSRNSRLRCDHMMVQEVSSKRIYVLQSAYIGIDSTLMLLFAYFSFSKSCLDELRSGNMPSLGQSINESHPSSLSRKQRRLGPRLMNAQ